MSRNLWFRLYHRWHTLSRRVEDFFWDRYMADYWKRNPGPDTGTYDPHLDRE